MRELARRGYTAVDVASVARALDELADPRRLVGLSFDDGYQDVADHALPVLRELGFRATVYIPTGVSDGRASFTWYEEQPRLMSWSTIRRLDGERRFVFEATPSHIGTSRNSPTTTRSARSSTRRRSSRTASGTR